MRRPRFRIRSLVLAIAFIALGLAVVLLSRENARLREAVSRPRPQFPIEWEVVQLKTVPVEWEVVQGNAVPISVPSTPVSWVAMAAPPRGVPLPNSRDAFARPRPSE